ncbi:hypothetical protein DUI87_01534 [Hirundo rustica rustica]|uniref:ribonuclease H n=1 Tax=Hirundo rustica rustica TaxID=333673 RepID=A0A3M0L4V6_HIRRU|nr:hypothetical protein DUI87_01534 [Hirundo rustica rustica]
MTPGEIFSQTFTLLFGSAPPAFVGFKSLNANDIIQWLVLLVCLFCLAFRDKGRLTWIITLIPTLEDRDTAPQPDPAPQPASEINHPDSVKEFHEMGQMLREYLSPVVASLAPAGGKPSPYPDKGESDGAAMEPTDVTTTQVPAEPQGQSPPAAVAPVETKKSKVKSANPGPSQYAIFIATIHPDNNRETVCSVANKLRNFKSMISGPMQAQVSAMAKELREDKGEDGGDDEEEQFPCGTECRPQFAFTWRGVQYTWNRLPQGWKHSPTICHGLIQAALEKGEAPEHLQYIDDIIVWADTAMEVFEKGEKIIQIILKAGFAIKKSKVKGPAEEIQFLGVKWQDGRHQIPTEVINKITAMSPPTNKKETQAFLGAIGFWRMHIPE